ncbi:hypothetical protein ACFO3J_23710 [Streptomyces polygonati]|uniref:Uncharacterized protein n=1 Tax=Streptomyces polygonati TaxID=1617087 RepID=A0ABV8HR06_9ACTN
MIYTVATACIPLTLAITRVLTIWVKERAYTIRLGSAVKDSKPEQRAELIRAWGEAEKHPESKHGPESSSIRTEDRTRTENAQSFTERPPA